MNKQARKQFEQSFSDCIKNYRLAKSFYVAFPITLASTAFNVFTVCNECVMAWQKRTNDIQLFVSTFEIVAIFCLIMCTLGYALYIILDAFDKCKKPTVVVFMILLHVLKLSLFAFQFSVVKYSFKIGYIKDNVIQLMELCKITLCCKKSKKSLLFRLFKLARHTIVFVPCVSITICVGSLAAYLKMKLILEIIQIPLSQWNISNFLMFLGFLNQIAARVDVAEFKMVGLGELMKKTSYFTEYYNVKDIFFVQLGPKGSKILVEKHCFLYAILLGYQLCTDVQMLVKIIRKFREQGGIFEKMMFIMVIMEKQCLRLSSTKYKCHICMCRCRKCINSTI